MKLTCTQRLLRVALAYLAALLVAGVVAPIIYRLGTSPVAVSVNLLLIGAVGYFALRAEGVTLKAAGATPGHLLRAVAVLGCTYGLFLLVLLALRAAGLSIGPLFRYPALWGLVDNWLITGPCEELLFRGFMLIAQVRLTGERRLPWRAVAIGALLFALFHLPMALGRLSGPDLAVHLGIPFASALIVFGPLYLLSRNLWLAALAHGVTNFPLVPQIQENPLLGLLFFAILLLLGRFLLRSNEEWPLSSPL